MADYHAKLTCDGMANPPLGQYVGAGGTVSFSGSFVKNDYGTSDTVECKICYRNLTTNEITCDPLTLDLGPSCKCSNFESPTGNAMTSTQPTCGPDEVSVPWNLGGSAGTCYSCEYDDPVAAVGPGGLSVWIG